MALIQAPSDQSTETKTDFPFRYIQNVPRNDQFFGREDCLTHVDRELRPDSEPTKQLIRSVVIHGLGGCGKSSVAKEYMYPEHNAGKYEVIIWFYADSRDKPETQFITLARDLGMKVTEPEARHAVLNWINNLGKSSLPSSKEMTLIFSVDREFLIVFDNADDPSFLRIYWPSTIRGAALITSRNLKTQEEGLARNGLALKPFEDSDGAVFLKSMLPLDFQEADEDERTIAMLSHRFGGLALALRQAGSVIRNKNCSPTKFLRLYQQRFEDIDRYQMEGYDKTIATTWTVSANALSDDSRILLDALSMLDPDRYQPNSLRW